MIGDFADDPEAEGVAALAAGVVSVSNGAEEKMYDWELLMTAVSGDGEW